MKSEYGDLSTMQDKTVMLEQIKYRNFWLICRENGRADCLYGGLTGNRGAATGRRRRRKKVIAKFNIPPEHNAPVPSISQSPCEGQPSCLSA
jgi:hypothetical protein